MAQHNAPAVDELVQAPYAYVRNRTSLPTGRHTVFQPPSFSRLMLADTPNSVRWARLHTVDFLTSWGIHPGVIETARLVVSELAGNAVQHSGDGAPRSFEVALEVRARSVRVSVWDADPAPPVLRQVGVDETAGRGIFIVAMMTERWGYYGPPGGRGKVVWADVALSVDAAGQGPHRSARDASPLNAGVAVGEQAMAEPTTELLARVLVGLSDP